MAGRVRQPIDVASLEKYISNSVPDIKTPVEVKQFGFGQSNPTYQLTSSNGTKYVLRKKPPGKLLSQAAHKVEREHRIISALGPTAVPVPKTFCLCEDDSVIGTPFYIMEFLDGRIIEDASMPGIAPGERTKMWEAATRTLARFHSVDYRKVGLGSFGKSEGFYDRQIATWTTICSNQEKTVDIKSGKAVGKIPHFEDMLAFFSNKSLQPAPRSTLVHGDYKLDNMVFNHSSPTVIGILDWEMSTVGHPLSDLANLLHGFYTVRMRPRPGYMSSAFEPGVTPGLPTPEQIIKWYSEEAGWDPRGELGWAMAFSVFRAAAIAQGIAARVARGQATSEKAREYVEAFKHLGEFAWELVQGEMTKAKAKL